MNTISTVPYRARAWWGDTRLADSTASLRTDPPPMLWFPWADVRREGLRSMGIEPWEGGSVEVFRCDGPAPARHEGVTWADPGARGDGTRVVRRWATPPPGFASLAGYASVDPHQARVEIVDEVEGEDPRDVTVKRFPTWGDAADLIAVLGDGAAVADAKRPVVEGSQMLGQAIVDAMRRAPGRRVASAHMLFVRAADAAHPVIVDLEPITDGRTFTSFAARAHQGGRPCAAGTVLLGVPSADVVRHGPDWDGVPGPYDAVPYDMGVTGRDLRVVDAAYTDDPSAPVGPPAIDAWVRFRHVPDDPALHAGLLAQFTGHMPIAAALRPHAGIGQWHAHRTISTAINAVAISLHADVRMDRWVLYRHVATVVADGMAHAECRAYDETGVLLASFTVDAMIRPLDLPGADARTAL